MAGSSYTDGSVIRVGLQLAASSTGIGAISQMAWSLASLMESFGGSSSAADRLSAALANQVRAAQAVSDAQAALAVAQDATGTASYGVESALIRQQQATKAVGDAQEALNGITVGANSKLDAYTRALGEESVANQNAALAANDLAAAQEVLSQYASAEVVSSSNAVNEAVYNEAVAYEAAMNQQYEKAAADKVVATSNRQNAEEAYNTEQQRLVQQAASKRATAEDNLVLAQQRQQLADLSVARAQQAETIEQSRLAEGVASAQARLDAANLSQTNADLAVNEANAGVAAAEQAANLGLFTAAALAASADALVFDSALKTIVGDASQLQYSSTQMDLALHGTQAQIDALNPKIIEWADNSLYTTSQVHQLVQALSERGLDVSQILNGDGQAAIQFGEAIGGDPVDSANILASTMQMFSEEGLTATQTANLLTGAFYQGIPSASDLQQAINGVGGEAAMLHIPLQDTMTVLDMLTQQLGSASTASDGLRYMLRGLIDPTSAQAKEIKALGINLFDAKGKFIGLKPAIEDVINALRTQTGGNQEGMAEALGKLFNIRSGQAAAILANMGDFSTKYNQIYQSLGKTSAKSDAQKELNTLEGATAKLKTTLTSLGAAISTELLPPLTQLANHFNQFVSWVMKLNPDLLKFLGIFIAVGAVLSTVVAIVLILIVVFMAVVAVAGVALIVTFGIVIVVIIAVAAIIALLIVKWQGIIWVATQVKDHVGQFFSWLGTAAHAAVNAVGAAFSRLGAWIHQHLNEAVAYVRFAWAMIPILFQLGLKKAEQIVHQAMQAIGNLFGWLYNHNYYFKALVDAIRKDFQDAHDAAIIIWTAITGWLSRTWNSIKDNALKVWSSLSNSVGGSMNVPSAQLQAGLANIEKFFASTWHTIQLGAGAAFAWLQSTFGTQFAALGTHVHKGLDVIGQLFSDLGTKMHHFGQVAMQMFITGLQGEIKALGNVLTTIANKVKSILGFHSPPAEGPLADSDTYMPNMMRMFATGITGNTGLFTGALNQVANAGRTTVSGGLLGIARAAGAGASSGQSVANFNVDGKTLFSVVMDRLTGEMRMNNLGTQWR